jgi:hypothetical protein
VRTIRRAAIEIKRRAGERQAVGEELRTAQKGGRTAQTRGTTTPNRSHAKAPRRKGEKEEKTAAQAMPSRIIIGFHKDRESTKPRNEPYSVATRPRHPSKRKLISPNDFVLSCFRDLLGTWKPV